MSLYQSAFSQEKRRTLGILNRGDLNREIITKVLKCVEEQKEQFDHKPHIIIHNYMHCLAQYLAYGKGSINIY